ncbi:hypothetical protein [Paenibacillus sp. 32352]|uniref:hypothetical protein n=1 Tax=Paenibacillus sp. 32352 TaxID=1969111 RepID=UPI0009AC0105|nr:hypothetical protein [Paenibacillus sp. 32352]
MSKKNIKWFWTFLILFAALLGLAALFQSDMLIYAASAIPIFIVLFLPDIKKHQYIRSRKHSKNFAIYKQDSGEETLVVIAFQPGFVRWKAGRLYFHLNDISEDSSKAASVFQGSEGTVASLPVLSFDLSAHKRKTGWISIDLAQLEQRTTNLSYTTDEINRLVIRLKDLEEAALTIMSASASSSKNKSKSISA